MLAAFILSVAVIGELYYFHFFTNEFLVGRQVARVTGGNGGYISSGFAVGILLAHFWFELGDLASQEFGEPSLGDDTLSVPFRQIDPVRPKP